MSPTASSPGDVDTSLKIRRLFDSLISPDLGFLHMWVSTHGEFTEVVGSRSHKFKSMRRCGGMAWGVLVN